MLERYLSHRIRLIASVLFAAFLFSSYVEKKRKRQKKRKKRTACQVFWQHYWKAWAAFAGIETEVHHPRPLGHERSDGPAIAGLQSTNSVDAFLHRFEKPETQARSWRTSSCSTKISINAGLRWRRNIFWQWNTISTPVPAGAVVTF